MTTGNENEIVVWILVLMLLVTLYSCRQSSRSAVTAREQSSR